MKLFFPSLRSLYLSFSVVHILFSSSCTKKEQATDPDGYLVKVSLASNFNRALVEKVRIVIDKSRWGQSLDLGAATSVTTTVSGGVTTETRVVSIDGDTDTEFVIEVPNSPFKQATSFQIYLASPGHTTRSFSVRASLLHGTLGTIGSIFTDQLPNGELLSFAPGRKREISFDFSCVADVSCVSDGGANQPPVLGNVAPQTINIKKEATLRISVATAAYDREGDTLTYAAFGEPMDAGTTSANNASIDSITGLFVWTPAASQVRDAGWGVTFSVSDPTNAAVSRATTINVTSQSSDPIWSPIGDRFAVEGQTLSVPLSVYDPDNEALTVALDLSGLPAGANAAVAMDGGDGTFTWAPTSKDGRTSPYTVKITARDPADASTVLQFDVRVLNVNDLPVVTAPDALTLKAGTTTVLTVSASDPDGDLVTLAADFSGLPSGYTWDGTSDPATSKTGTFRWNPSEADVRAAPYVATFTAVDVNGGGTVKSVSLTVTGATSGNAAPTLSGPAGPQAEEGKALAFSVTASDPEAAALTLSMDAGGLPVGNNAAFAVDAGAGTFTWTPATGTARGDAYRVTFTATDVADASTNLDVLITVSAPQPVVDAGPDASADAGPDAGVDAGPDAGEDAGPPPVVTSTSPANGAANVPLDASVVVTFDTAMDAGSVMANFGLRVNDAGVAGSVIYAGLGATFTPSALLSYNTVYTATVASSAVKANGVPLDGSVSWSFTTLPPPPLVIVARSPAPSATWIPVDASIVVSFDQPLDGGSVTASTFSLVGDAGTVAGALSVAGATATLTPTAPLSNNLSYTASLAPSVMSAYGGPLDASVVWSFTTRLEEPVVVAFSPASNAVGVTLVAPVIVDFSMAMSATSFDGGAFRLVDQSDASVAGTLVVDAGTITFTPAARLTRNALYTATVTTAATNSVGTALAAPSTWSFTSTWTVQIGSRDAGSCCNVDDVARGIAIDSSGNLLITGVTYGDLDGLHGGGLDPGYFHSDVFVVKLNPQGIRLWARQIGTQQSVGNGVSYHDEGNGISVDQSGYVYVAGASQGSFSSYGAVNQSTGGDYWDALAMKLEPTDGGIEWLRLMGIYKQDRGLGGVATAAGDFFMTGHVRFADDAGADAGFDGQPMYGDQDMFVTKWASDGGKIWTRLFGNDQAQEGSAVCLGSGDALYVVGYNTNTSLWGPYVGGYDVIIGKLDQTDGGLVWGSQYGSNRHERGAQSATNFACALDPPSGDIFLTGITRCCGASAPGPFGSAARIDTDGEMGDVLVARVGADGGLLWSKYLGTRLNEDFRDIKVDKSGNLFVLGTTPGLIESDVDASTDAGADIFLAKLEPTDGGLIWMKRFGTPGNDYAGGLAIDDAGSIFVTGYTAQAFLGQVSLGGYDIFILKLSSDGVVQ